ncbi:MAG: ATP-binding protein [Thermofilum sp.]|nr:ATP-binding protein [Thermofilum sp.]
MLGSLWARDFLSLRDVRVELGKLNVLVGPNASGKSNVMRALELLAAHARRGPVLEGYEEAWHLVFRFDRAGRAEVGVEADLSGGWRAGFAVRLAARSYEEEAWLEGERLLYHDGSKPSFEYLSASGGARERAVSGDLEYYKSGYVRSSALSEVPEDAHPALGELASLLKSVVVLSPSPGKVREPALLGAGGVGREGEGLAALLLRMYLEEREKFEIVEEVVRSLTPRVRRIIPRIVSEGGEYRVELLVEEEGLGRVPLSNVSDGTLRVIALATALYGGARVVALEEPENCVHPRLLEALVDAMRDAPAQVVATTHSPYLLDHVEPEEVYVVSRVGLETKVKRLSETEEVKLVKRFLEEGGTLGEAWYSGLLGEAV